VGSFARLPCARYVPADSLPGKRPEESIAPQRIAAIRRIQPEDGLIRAAESSDAGTIVARLYVDQGTPGRGAR